MQEQDIVIKKTTKASNSLIDNDCTIEPITKVSEQVKKVKPRKLRHSCFKILINSNISTDEDDPRLEGLQKQMIDAYTDCFKDNIGSYIVFRDTKDPSACWDPKYIKKCKSGCKLEIGPRDGKLHLHSAMHIQHWSNIQLDKKKIRNCFNKFLDTKSVFLDIYHVPFRSTKEITMGYLLDYVYKTKYQDEKEEEPEKEKVEEKMEVEKSE